ncbi:hypothetical protein LZ32DRAFT_598582 [Colletotrichum eremochloae]|nr:hypothetical protein LZ32DRAFT_598582 [Colletotrichum eremochloae]
MQFNVNLFVVTLLATAELATARICVLNAIECQYPKGRCARTCWGIDCVCPDAREAQGGSLTGSACINMIKALGRHQC